MMSKVELEEQSKALLNSIVRGVSSGQAEDPSGPAWSSARELLQDISASRARQGQPALPE